MHISPRWRKVFRDLWDHKARTVLVVISIAVGVFAVGMISGSSEVMTREMNTQWAVTNPPQATFYTSPFDADFVATVRNMPEVADAEARRNFTARFAVARDGLTVNNATPDATWRNLSLYAYPDIEEIRVGKLRPLSGAFPPGKDEVVLERLSGPWMGVQIGDTVIAEGANGKLRELRVAGTLHDLTQSSSSWDGRGKGYITPETMRRLGIDGGFTELNIIAAGDAGLTKEGVTAVANEVVNKLEGSGRVSDFMWIPTPGRTPRGRDGRADHADPGHPRRAGADRQRLPGGQHHAGAALAADPPDRHHQGDRRAGGPDHGHLLRDGAGLCGAGAAHRRAAGRDRRARHGRAAGRHDQLRHQRLSHLAARAGAATRRGAAGAAARRALSHRLRRARQRPRGDERLRPERAEGRSAAAPTPSSNVCGGCRGRCCCRCATRSAARAG